MKGSEEQMIDEIYSIWTPEDAILIFSLFINLGLFLDYIDRKITKKLKERRKRKCLIRK